MYRFIWLVPLLPLAGAAINGLLGRRLRFSERLVGAVGVGSVALAFLLSLSAVVSYGFGEHALWPQPYVTKDGAFTWIPGGAVEITQGAAEREHAAAPQTLGINPVQHSEGLRASATTNVGGAAGALLNVEWSYQLDPLSAVFMLIITGVGLCIFVFATGYMHGDRGFYRFFAYLGLFMFMMLVLVMGSNFLMMFVGWEGVGL